jgi:hypothetical protein
MFQVSLESNEIATKEDNSSCQRCQMLEHEQEKQKSMELILKEQEERIEELQKRLQMLTVIKDNERFIENSFMSMQSGSSEQVQDTVVDDVLLSKTDWTESDEETWMKVQDAKSTPWSPWKKKEDFPSIDLCNRFFVLDDESTDNCTQALITEEENIMKLPTTESTPKILFIGDSIVRNIHLDKKKARITKICCSGKRVKEVHGRAMLEIEHKPDLETVIFHAGVNDLRQKETETLKSHFCSLAEEVSKAGKNLVISGPLPMTRKGCEAFSRLLSLNDWLIKWCAEENLQFVDNFDTFWERPTLVGRDGLHPTQEGANAIAVNIMKSLNMQ